MRLFVGILPDEQTRSYFRDLKQHVAKFKRNFNFVPLDQSFLRLWFLGNAVETEVLEWFAKELNNQISQTKSFEYRLKRPNFGFQSQVIPKAIFANVENEKPFVEISHTISDVVKSVHSAYLNTRQTQKKLLHYYTLAHLKSDVTKPFAARFKPVLDTFPAPDFDSKVSHISIIQSKIETSSVSYKPILNIKIPN